MAYLCHAHNRRSKRTDRTGRVDRDDLAVESTSMEAVLRERLHELPFRKGPREQRRLDRRIGM
jgi:hypothetical protein